MTPNSDEVKMADQTWYLYQNGQQVGPFDTDQVSQLYTNNMVSQDSYIFKVGWKEWLPMEEGYEQLGINKPGNPSKSPKEVEKRKSTAPRATVEGKVIVHNDGQLSIGQGANISSTGIFVETNDNLFQIGEQLKLTVKCQGLEKAFNVIAEVIRYNDDPRFPVGYGLKFENLDLGIKDKIDRLVKRKT